MQQQYSELSDEEKAKQGFNQNSNQVQGFSDPSQQYQNQQQQQFNCPPQQQQMYIPPQDPTQMQQPYMPPSSSQPFFQQSAGASPLDKFMTMEGIYLKQKVNYIEAFTGCVQQNRYSIFQADATGQQISTIPFMEIKEQSSCLQRQCLPSQCREYELQFTFIIENIPGSGQFMEQLTVTAKKGCQCTFFCANRPVLEVFQHLQNGEQLKLGQIKNPFMCCDLKVQAERNEKNPLYTVYGSCCQLGILFPAPCKPCQEVDFDVKTPQGENIVPLKKQSPGCWRACLSNTDYFSVVFPNQATKEERLLLIASTVMVDYMYFNDQPEKNKNRQQNIINNL